MNWGFLHCQVSKKVEVPINISKQILATSLSQPQKYLLQSWDSSQNFSLPLPTLNISNPRTLPLFPSFPFLFNSPCWLFVFFVLFALLVFFSLPLSSLPLSLFLSLSPLMAPCIQLPMLSLDSFRCLWLCPPSLLQWKPSSQPYLEVVMSSSHSGTKWIKWGHGYSEMWLGEGFLGGVMGKIDRGIEKSWEQGEKLGD